MDERLPRRRLELYRRHTDGYMDLPRIWEGGLDAEFFAIYMEREPRPGMAVKGALAQIESIHALCEKYPADIALATTADEVRAIAASGRVAALMGLEGGSRRHWARLRLYGAGPGRSRRHLETRQCDVRASEARL